MPSQRVCLLLLTAFCASLISIGLIMQHVFDMAPCPLCISQRIFIILAGLTALLGATLAHKRLALISSNALGIVFAIIGGGISARHVWIQNLPEDDVPGCGPGLSYMFETRPVFDALTLLFQGDGHCADVNWTFLGLSIPAWTFVCFVSIAITFGLLFYKGLKQKGSVA